MRKPSYIRDPSERTRVKMLLQTAVAVCKWILEDDRVLKVIRDEHCLHWYVDDSFMGCITNNGPDRLVEFDDELSAWMDNRKMIKADQTWCLCPAQVHFIKSNDLFRDVTSYSDLLTRLEAVVRLLGKSLRKKEKS